MPISAWLAELGEEGAGDHAFYARVLDAARRRGLLPAELEGLDPVEAMRAWMRLDLTPSRLMVLLEMMAAEELRCASCGDTAPPWADDSAISASPTDERVRPQRPLPQRDVERRQTAPPPPAAPAKEPVEALAAASTVPPSAATTDPLGQALRWGESTVSRGDIVLRRYRLGDLLGEGGMGTVFSAEDLVLKREVAVKVLRPAGPQASRRFEREAVLAASLRHPHIVTIHEVHITAWEESYLVMDKVRGPTLGEAAADLPLRARIEQLREAAEAIGFAHDAGIIHRDIKPANILLHGDRAMVVDFGLAKPLDDTDRMTRTGAAVGTLCYMAPEQIQGKPGIGPAADVWGLGATLYELLTGSVPYGYGPRAAILHALAHRQLVPPRAIDRQLPRDLDAICRQALRLDPSDRYADANAFAADLARYLDGAPVHAREPSRARRILTWIGHRPRRTAAITLLLLAALAAGARYHQRRAHLASQLAHLDQLVTQERWREAAALATLLIDEENSPTSVPERVKEAATTALREAKKRRRAIESSERRRALTTQVDDLAHHLAAISYIDRHPPTAAFVRLAEVTPELDSLVDRPEGPPDGDYRATLAAAHGWLQLGFPTRALALLQGLSGVDLPRGDMEHAHRIRGLSALASGVRRAGTGEPFKSQFMDAAQHLRRGGGDWQFSLAQLKEIATTVEGSAVAASGRSTGDEMVYLVQSGLATRPQDGRRLANRAISIRPGYPLAVVSRAVWDYRLGNLQQARQGLVHALRLNPTYWPARALLVRDGASIGASPEIISQAQRSLVQDWHAKPWLRRQLRPFLIDRDLARHIPSDQLRENILRESIIDHVMNELTVARNDEEWATLMRLKLHSEPQERRAELIQEALGRTRNAPMVLRAVCQGALQAGDGRALRPYLKSIAEDDLAAAIAAKGFRTLRMKAELRSLAQLVSASTRNTPRAGYVKFIAALDNRRYSEAVEHLARNSETLTYVLAADNRSAIDGLYLAGDYVGVLGAIRQLRRMRGQLTSWHIRRSATLLYAAPSFRKELTHLARSTCSVKDASRFWFAWACFHNAASSKQGLADLPRKLKAPYSTILARRLRGEKPAPPPRSRPILLLEGAVSAARSGEWQRAMSIAESIGKNPETMREGELIVARSLIGLGRLNDSLSKYVQLCKWNGLRDRAQIGVLVSALALERDLGRALAEPTAKAVRQALEGGDLLPLWDRRGRREAMGPLKKIMPNLLSRYREFGEVVPARILESLLSD